MTTNINQKIETRRGKTGMVAARVELRLCDTQRNKNSANPMPSKTFEISFNPTFQQTGLSKMVPTILNNGNSKVKADRLWIMRGKEHGGLTKIGGRDCLILTRGNEMPSKKVGDSPLKKIIAKAAKYKELSETRALTFAERLDYQNIKSFVEGV